MANRCDVEAILDEVARGRTEAFGQIASDFGGAQVTDQALTGIPRGCHDIGA